MDNYTIRQTKIDEKAMNAIISIIRQNDKILDLLCNPPMIIEPNKGKEQDK